MDAAEIMYAQPSDCAWCNPGTGEGICEECATTIFAQSSQRHTAEVQEAKPEVAEKRR
jgi:hypothetical protein